MILTKEKIESFDLYGTIDEYIKSDESEKVLIVVPTNRRLRSLKKELIDLSPNQTISKIRIETLDTLFTKLLENILAFIQLTEASASVMIKQSVEECKLNYFRNYDGNFPGGTLDRIKNVISEYKRHGITPEVLLRESESLSASEKLKAIDIAAIYSRYLEKTTSINALEIGDVYSRLLSIDTQEYQSNFLSIFERVSLVGLLGFDEFSQPEIELINRIAEINELKLFVDFDYYDYNPIIFAHLEKTHKQLAKYDFKSIEDKSVYALPGFAQTVRENLFLRKKQKVSKYSGGLTQIEAGTREEEIELIAKQIKNLLIDKKVKPHSICVVFNLISEYSPLVRDVFERVGIPYNLTDRILLDQSPPVIAIVNFLDIAESDYYYKNIFRAFNSKFFKELDVDVANLNFIASELKIVSGLYNWKNSIANTLENKFGDERKISDTKLERALKDLLKIEERLKPFLTKQKPKDFFHRLLQLVTNSNISKEVLRTNEKNREENIVGLTTFLETIEEILELIDLQHESKKEFSLSYYLDQIKTACGWARFNVKGRSDYGVLVTSVNEIRGLKFDHLFIAGLNEGNFPTRFNPEIFFSGSFAKKENTHQTEERFHFYQTLTSWEKELYLSYSLTNGEKELVKSNFLSEFSNQFDNEFIDKSTFENTAYNIEDVHIYAAKNLSINSKISPLNGLTESDIEELRNKIEVSKTRIQNPHSISDYNGFISSGDDEKHREVLKSISDREYSITQLETYAKCPFKYFMQYVLGLTQTSDPTEEVEAVEMGSVLHKIMYEFYTRVRERDISISNCDDNTFQQLVDLIFQIGKENLSSPIFASEITFFDKEKILGVNGDKKESILYKFLLKEREDKPLPKPSYFEVAFGDIGSRIKDEKLISTAPIGTEKVTFKGKIDRIDVSSEDNSFDVIDYKLSMTSKPTSNDINRGISLQLPLYLFAAQKLFEQNKISLNPSEAFLYSLKFSETEFGKNKISLISRKSDNQEEMKKLIDETLGKIESYVERIIKGEFPLTDLEDRETKVCRYCDFRKICRIDETEL